MDKFLKIVFIVLAVSLIVGLSLIAPIDRRPLKERDFYRSMMLSLDTLSMNVHAADTALFAGWHRENLMPEFVTPMAGYKPRNQYENVHDSLYVHVLLLDNGNATVALVSYDLLITPPLLKKRIQEKSGERIPEIDFIYFSASHTHNGIGGWDSSPGGQIMTGKYDEDILLRLEEKTFECIVKARETTAVSRFSYFEAPANKYVQNRLDALRPEDGKMRGIEIENINGKKALLATYAAHATNIPSRSLTISDDYPGQLTTQLESNGYNFSMFMAGTVGSHRLDSIEGESFDRIRNAGEKLSRLVLNSNKDTIDSRPNISFRNIPIEFGPSQMRIAANFRLRDWAFKTFFGPLEGKVQYLTIGDLVFLGMPCDFSGEILVENGLYTLAEKAGKKLIITSFNGDYVGYITEDYHYEVTKRAEVREMNWVGPYYGDYFSDIVAALLNR